MQGWSKTVLLLAAGSVLAAGCAREPTTFGAQVTERGQEIRRLGEEWEHGAKMISRGQELIDEGERLIERGRTMIAEGQQKKLQSETAYRALGAPMPAAPPPAAIQP